MINKLLHYTSAATKIKHSSKDEKKQRRNRQRHEFLLTFFDKPNRNDQQTINGYILNRYFNTATGNWEVMVYTQESWSKTQNYLQHQDTPIKSPQHRTKFQNLFSELNGAVNKTA